MPDSRSILLTGATGFVGRHLVERLAGEGHRLSAVVRDPAVVPSGMDQIKRIDDLAAGALPPGLLEGVDTVLHLAARVDPHARGGDPAESPTAHMARTVASAAREAGTPRVLVLSSIYARLAETGDPAARSYGREKLAADRIFGETLGPEQRLVILRPPVVYGAGMRGSLASLAKLAGRGAPLPLGGARAARSYISRANLCDLIATMVAAPDACWREADRAAFEPSDGAPVSTRDLVSMLSERAGRPPRLWPVPGGLLRVAGRLAGKSDMVTSALDPLVLEDNARIERIFGWRPREAMPASLAALG